MAEFIVTDPSGKEFVVTAPEGATSEQALEFAKSQFGSTAGGAATGNPSIEAQGMRSAGRPQSAGEALGKIGAATGIGGLMGWGSPEIMKFLSGLSQLSPYTRPAAPYLSGAGDVLRTQRGAAATSGAVSGAASETAGQAVELSGFPGLPAEGARLAVGGATGALPELKTAAAWAAGKVTGIPAIRQAIDAGVALLEKNGGRKLSKEEAEYVAREIQAIRGRPKETGSQEGVYGALEEAGRREGAEASSAMDDAGNRLVAARSAPVGGAAMRDPSDIGIELRDAIGAKHKALFDTRKQEYKATEQLRDALVLQRESAGQHVNQVPEFKTMVDTLKADLEPGKRSKDIQRGIQKILSELEGEVVEGEKKLVLSGQNLDLVGETKNRPISFQALDDVRRKLGEVYRGKPPEGYEALHADMARELYAKISKIQERFAGGEKGPHAKLLEDYARQSGDLDRYRTARGRKATAVDRYDPEQFTTDAQALPTTYFKSKESVRALKELTGDDKLVNKTALEYANRELANADAKQAQAYLQKEWLNELPQVKLAVAQRAEHLRVAERLVESAENVAKNAAERNKRLLGNKTPSEQVRSIILSGDRDLWRQAGPAIAASSEGRAAIADAVRQTVADAAEGGAKGLQRQFNGPIKELLMEHKLMGRAELERISSHIENIVKLNLPEPQQLGLVKRMVLQLVAGEGSSVAARSAFALRQKEREVPQ